MIISSYIVETYQHQALMIQEYKYLYVSSARFRKIKSLPQNRDGRPLPSVIDMTPRTLPQPPAPLLL